MTEGLKSDRIFEELNSKINEYFHALWEEDGESEAGDYIDSWALVANYGNLNHNSMSGGYVFEIYPPKTPPHSAKGLFREGVACIEYAQKEAYSADDNDE